MQGPQVLLLDEPSMGLAPKLVLDTMRIVKRLNDEGATILLVEQNARLALKLADYGYVLEGGLSGCRGRPPNCAPTHRSSRPISGIEAEPAQR